MHFLEYERAALADLLPGLDDALTGAPLPTWETPGNPGLDHFRAAGGPGLLVPAEHGGKGADLLAAVRVQRAVGSRSPSLAIATTMHHFSVASLVETAARSSGMEWMLLAAIVKENLLLASGFAEGRTGQGILNPAITARVEGDKVWLNGVKKPCSLAWSMDLLTASFPFPDEDGTARLAVAVVPAKTPGLSVRPFWKSPVLAGTESDEVVLEDVEVPGDLLVRTDVSVDGELDHLNTVGFVWFEALMTASYLGAASALVERTLARPGVPAAARAQAVTAVESAALMLRGLAARASDAPIDDEVLAQALVSRYTTQDLIGRVLDVCVEALGGMAFVSGDDIAYLNSACRALAFHPPSRSRMHEALAGYFGAGESLRIPA
ncbi:MAG: acyl-CoA/acyl-ACP dehydrogenase [Streptomyces sp.]|uniref:acyl-CoA dehydrogenase family protein n=1 Tax=Streptomyces sp. TaxID=1931 RepID=UPI0025E4F056|nr:acyl-CoA dehydrogenase family protein [Streptomyces sp.]MBW8795394.1 acyl-CoA/acyl-ACP dehydrogenase [Streptomyces sp.]